MRIEHFSDEHGIHVRASEEVFLMTRDEARSHLLYLRELQAENAKLRELVRDMWHDGMCECDERGACAECEYHYTDRMRELGVDA